MDVVYFGENRLSVSLRNKERNIGDQLNKGSNLEQRERKYGNTWGGGGRARGDKSLQNHFHLILCINSSDFN